MRREAVIIPVDLTVYDQLLVAREQEVASL